MLKNSKEQTIVEKLRALVSFGVNDRRYKDIYDLYYLKDHINGEKLLQYIDLLIYQDETMRENAMEDIIRRIEMSFKDKSFLKRISTSRQRWIDGDIESITDGIVNFFEKLKMYSS